MTVNAGEKCAACGLPVDSLSYPGLYISSEGFQHPHFLCSSCGRAASVDGHGEVAEAVELRFGDAEGTA